MNTDSRVMRVRGLDVLVVRKAIKNVHLSVLPPKGKVRVTAPQAMNADAIRMLVATRLPWITKRIGDFEAQERQTPRQYVSGETHYSLGKRYRLDVEYLDRPPRVSLKGKTKIILQVRPGTAAAKRGEILDAWYRIVLKEVLAPLAEKWERAIGVKPKSYEIKKMKTRWGTCNVRQKRIWLNSELAKKPKQCIEFIIVHELLHFLERNHNDRFVKHIDHFLPQWRLHKDELNRAPLSHSEWSY